MSKRFFWPNHYKKTVFMFMRSYKEILPSEVAQNFSFFDLMDLTIWDFWQTARRGAMRSKTQWVIYRDLDWGPGPQKNQFGEIAGYPEVVGLFLALLRTKELKNLHWTKFYQNAAIFSRRRRCWSRCPAINYPIRESVPASITLWYIIVIYNSIPTYSIQLSKYGGGRCHQTEECVH